jgi:hypothetical protein
MSKEDAISELWMEWVLKKQQSGALKLLDYF